MTRRKRKGATSKMGETVERVVAPPRRVPDICPECDLAHRQKNEGTLATICQACLSEF